MTRDDELRIIKRVTGGDYNAFEELVIANQTNVYNLAFRMTKNEEDAADISQEAFFKAYTQLKSFRGESRFSVWMYRLTYNLCIDFLRKKPLTKTVSLSYQNQEDEEADMEIPDTRELPEDIIINEDTRKTILRSIDELGEDHREVLVMREITGMSYSEMAYTLKISEGTVKSRLARARKTLVGILAEKGTFPEDFRLNKREEVEQYV